MRRLAAVLLGLALSTSLCATARADRLDRALDLYSIANTAIFIKAAEVGASSYDVTECTVDGDRGTCQARLFAVSDLGWVRDDFTISGSWRAGRLTVSTGADHWRLVTKQQVYDASHPAAALRRGLTP